MNEKDNMTKTVMAFSGPKAEMEDAFWLIEDAEFDGAEYLGSEEDLGGFNQELLVYFVRGDEAELEALAMRFTNEVSDFGGADIVETQGE